MKLLSVLLIIMGTFRAGAAPAVPASLIRPLSASSASFAVARLPFEGQFSEGYVYSDVHANATALLEIARYFDEKVYPKYISGLTADPLGATRPREKIVLLFDSFKGLYPAYHSRALDIYGRDFILIDIDSVMNSNYVDYYLPHELQHVFRARYSPREADWLNEGLSKFAEYFMNGRDFPVGYFDSFTNAIGLSLFAPFASSANANEYFNDMLFVFYLYKHYGGLPVVQKLLASPLTGSAAVNAAIAGQPMGTFAKAFTNYSLALILNSSSTTIESGGFWDLRLNEDVDPRYAGFSVTPEDLTRVTGKQLALNAVSSRYIGLSSPCVQVSVGPSIVAALVDTSASPVVHVLDSDARACVSNVRGTGQYLVLINTNERAAETAVIQ